jgi:hypothetical protein
MGNEREDLWVPDNPDGSGWADVDWVSATRGSRYHYGHGGVYVDDAKALPPLFRVTTRLESAQIRPHVNTYYVPGTKLHDFVEELVWNGGAERLWAIEPATEAPPEARVETEEPDSGT